MELTNDTGIRDALQRGIKKIAPVTVLEDGFHG